MSQPVEVYPNTVEARQSSTNPNGSFGPVLIVLAIIFVLSAVACVVGRFYGRRHHHFVKESHQAKAKQIHHPLGPQEWEFRQKPNYNTRDGDIEFGFDKKISTSKKGANGNSRGPQIGGFRGEVRFADNIV